MALTWDSFASTWDSPDTWDGPAAIAGTGASIGGGVATVLVQAAFGADLTASPGTWTWTDITSDVMYDAKVTITQGRGDETSQAQPAQCSFTLLNTAGNYTPYNPNSTYYPNVRKNTPIRVSLDPGTGYVVAFFGYANGWPPGWDTSAKLATVTATASGVMRRLGQQKTPVRSPLFRTISQSSPLAWWPMEDGSSTTQAASGIAGGAPLRISSGSVAFTSDDHSPGASGSARFATGGTMSGPVPSGSSTTWRVEFDAKFGTIAVGDFNAIMQWYTSGSVSLWEVDATDAADGGFYIQYIDNSGGFDAAYSNVKVDDGAWHRFRIDGAQSGGNIAITVKMDGVTIISHTFSTLTNGSISRVTINPTRTVSEEIPAISHVAVWAPYSASVDTFYAATGYAGETAGDRITRLCAEQGVSLSMTGTAGTLMGAQPVGSFLDLLRDCEATDGGVLYDGFDSGIGYIARSSRYNLATSLTLDVSVGDVAPPFAPADDDQRIHNDVTVSRSSGSSARAIITGGPLGTASVGTYDTSLSVNSQGDNVLPGIAGWNAYLGTVDGLRYPVLNLDLIATPGKVASWVAAPDISFRADVNNVTQRATQAPPDNVSLLVEGYTQSINNTTWQITCNCSPFAPWNVATITDSSRGRIGTSGSALNANITSGATSFAVKSTSTGGYLWDTGATNFDVNIGGERMTVGSVSGASSPQTFSSVTRAVNGVVKAHNANDVVKLWQPAIIAL